MPPFRGFVLGLRAEDIRTALEAQGLPAQVQHLPPPLSLILGLSRNRYLERRATPDLRRVIWRFLLLGFWSVTAMVFIAAVASFFVPVSMDLRVALVLVTVGIGIAGLIATGWYWTRIVNGDRDPSDLGAAAGVPWDVLILAPEAGLAALAVTLVVILVAFVLFAVWLPLLFVVLNLLTLGELWRRYRGVLVTAPANRPERIGRAGRELLRRGGVLSRSWDAHLDLDDLGTAVVVREAHARIERRLILVGLASLLLVGVYLARRFLPPAAWDPTFLGTAGFTALALVVLLGSLWRGRRSRPHWS